MKYAYEDLGPDQFEHLIVCLCNRLPGIATQGFAAGPDGGRDAKFVGKTDLFPSISSPWTGITIIQAKHTNGYNKSFSEPDFGRLLKKEIPKIKKLRKAGQLDNYILFSNRRLTAGKQTEIQSNISKQCDIPESSISLRGLNDLEIWLKSFPEVAAMAKLDMVDSPLSVSSDDLAEVIEALASFNASTLPTSDEDKNEIIRIPYADKNKINNMSVEYAKNLEKKYLSETKEIKDFLSMPENDRFVRLYDDIVDDFQLKIIAKRKNHQDFDSVINYLFDLLFARDSVLKKNQKLTKTMLFYMYWNCDIGSEENASSK